MPNIDKDDENVGSEMSKTPNPDEVICPNCAHQFRAIPENVQAALAAAQEARCEHCGADVYSGPPDCPRCGAPNCCPQCCKIDTLERQLAAAKKEG